MLSLMPSARQTGCGTMREEWLRHTSRFACERRVYATLALCQTIPNTTACTMTDQVASIH